MAKCRVYQPAISWLIDFCSTLFFLCLCITDGLFSRTFLRHMFHLYHDKYPSLRSISKLCSCCQFLFSLLFCCLLLWHSIYIPFTKALWRQLQTFFPSSFKFSFFFISACYLKGTSRLLESWNLWLTPSYRGGSEEDCEPPAPTSWQWYKGFQASDLRYRPTLYRFQWAMW